MLVVVLDSAIRRIKDTDDIIIKFWIGKSEIGKMIEKHRESLRRHTCLYIISRCFKCKVAFQQSSTCIVFATLDKNKLS